MLTLLLFSVVLYSATPSGAQVNTPPNTLDQAPGPFHFQHPEMPAVDSPEYQQARENLERQIALARYRYSNPARTESDCRAIATTLFSDYQSRSFFRSIRELPSFAQADREKMIATLRRLPDAKRAEILSKLTKSTQVMSLLLSTDGIRTLDEENEEELRTVQQNAELRSRVNAYFHSIRNLTGQDLRNTSVSTALRAQARERGLRVRALFFPNLDTIPSERLVSTVSSLNELLKGELENQAMQLFRDSLGDLISREAVSSGTTLQDGNAQWSLYRSKESSQESLGIVFSHTLRDAIEGAHALRTVSIGSVESINQEATIGVYRGAGLSFDSYESSQLSLLYPVDLDNPTRQPLEENVPLAITGVTNGAQLAKWYFLARRPRLELGDPNSIFMESIEGRLNEVCVNRLSDGEFEQFYLAALANELRLE